jgi:hypothetical protein
MADKNEMNAWALLLAPVVIAAVLSSMVPAYPEFINASWKVGAYYAAALLIGFILFRRARSVRDHEYHRTKSIKGLKKAYAAEDRGLWSKADAAMAGLERDAEGYTARDRELLRTKQTDEIEKRSLRGEKSDDEPDVHLFIDEEHVKRSTSRMSGDTNIDPEAAITGETMERMREEKSSFLNQVSDKLEDMRQADIEKRAKKIKETVAVKKVEPKPTPTVTAEVKEDYDSIYGGDRAAAGRTEADPGEEELATSTGGGEFTGKGAKICIDCGARNALKATYCTKCSGFLA